MALDIAATPPRPARSWGHTALIWTLIRTDFKSRYHGTAAGFLWALLKPLAMLLVLIAVFSFIFTGDPNYPVKLIIGLCLYEFFSDATKVGLVSLQTKSFLLTKTRAPLWIIVTASISNALITLGVFGVAIVAILTVRGQPPSAAAMALALVYLLHYFAMVVGFCLGASVLFLKYRDLNQAWEVVIQAGFFLAPIVYPLDILPERVHFYLFFWPPTPVIQFMRMVLVEGRFPTARGHLYLTLMAAAIFLVGALVFRHHSRRAAEYL
jgi:lipopolysaccharide transport system permease protein